MFPLLLAVIAYLAFRDQKTPGEKSGSTGGGPPPATLPAPQAPQAPQWHACELAEGELDAMTPALRESTSALVAGTNASLMLTAAAAIETLYPLTAACLRARAVEVQRAANTGRHTPATPPFVPESVFTAAATSSRYR